jgi:hypothetical protein
MATIGHLVMMYENWCRGQTMSVSSILDLSARYAVGEESTDPRDKVFAFLGLADENDPKIDVDYSLEPLQVFWNHAKIQARSNEWFKLLEDARRHRETSIPSWVPDYGKATEDLGAEMISASHCATKGMLPSTCELDGDDFTLSIDVIMLPEFDTASRRYSFKHPGSLSEYHGADISLERQSVYSTGEDARKEVLFNTSDAPALYDVGPNGCNCIGFVVDVVLISKVGGRPVAIYLLVNVLNIYADDADDVDDVDDVDNVDDVDDVGDADLAKTLLSTYEDVINMMKNESIYIPYGLDRKQATYVLLQRGAFHQFTPLRTFLPTDSTAFEELRSKIEIISVGSGSTE